MCRVLNKHHAGVPVGAVYIGRGSKWGNLRLRGRRMSFCATVIDVGHT
jgi:hypothetical protein